MKPDEAKSEFERRIAGAGVSLEKLTPAHGIRLMLRFYGDIRAGGCPLDADADMLLFQWGNYDFGDGLRFQIDITRQFITTGPAAVEDTDDPSDGADEDRMSQLSLTFRFVPTPETAAFGEGNFWCHTPEERAQFSMSIAACPAFVAVGAAHPTDITLDYSYV